MVDTPLLKNGTLFMPAFTEALASYTFPVAFSGLKTVAASFGARGGAIGAAMSAIDEAIVSDGSPLRSTDPYAFPGQDLPHLGPALPALP